MRNSFKGIIALACSMSAVVLGQLILGATAVDQGAPGKQGAWPVSVTTAISLSDTAVTLDGGFTKVFGSVYIDGGSITPSPSSTATGVTTTSGSLPVQASGCTTVGDTDCTNIFGGASGANLLAYRNFTITLENRGANAITDCLTEFSNDSTHWELWDNTWCAALAAGATKSLAFGENSRKFLRMEARSASGTDFLTTVNTTTQAF